MHASPLQLAKWSPARRDGALITLLVVLVAAAALYFQIAEHLYRFTRYLERYQIDELPYVLLALSVGLIWYARRRTREARLEAEARRAAELRLEDALDDLRRLASERLTHQEYERKAIARDLHDDLSQHLTALRLDASLLARSQAPEEVRQRASSLTDAINELQARVRDLIARLRPVALDELGLCAALEHFVSLWQKRSPDCILRLESDPRMDSLGEASALTAYRVVQEGVVNALRHARARRIIVRARVLTRADGSETAAIVVEDDGKGCGPDGPVPGYGLRGMRERLQASHGELLFHANSPAGLILEAQLPLTETR